MLEKKRERDTTVLHIGQSEITKLGQKIKFELELSSVGNQLFDEAVNCLDVFHAVRENWDYDSLRLELKNVIKFEQSDPGILSIAKWLWITLSFDVGFTSVVKNGANQTCGYCREFIHTDHDKPCEKCPIFQAGLKADDWWQFCEGTPFENVVIAPNRENALAELLFLIEVTENFHHLPLLNKDNP